MGKEAYNLNVNQYCCGGLNFGYFYAQSPIIAYDGGEHPTYTMYEFTPSTVPGCRAPHFFLPNGQSLYDLLGPDYSILRFDPTVRSTESCRPRRIAECRLWSSTCRRNAQAISIGTSSR